MNLHFPFTIRRGFCFVLLCQLKMSTTLMTMHGACYLLHKTQIISDPLESEWIFPYFVYATKHEKGNNEWQDLCKNHVFWLDNTHFLFRVVVVFLASTHRFAYLAIFTLGTDFDFVLVSFCSIDSFIFKNERRKFGRHAVFHFFSKSCSNMIR